MDIGWRLPTFESAMCGDLDGFPVISLCDGAGMEAASLLA